MTAILSTSLLFVVIGAVIALALPARPRHWHALFGEAYLLGAGAAGLVLLALSAAGIRWSRGGLGAGLAIIFVIALATAIGRGRPELQRPRIDPVNLVDLFTAVLMFGHFLLATAAEPFETDYLLIWGVKARMFLSAGGIDWTFLREPLNPAMHGGYPVLVPLIYDAYAVVIGAWPELVGFVTFACGAAALLAFRSSLSDDMPKLERAVATLILMPLVFSPFIGMAEGPLIAYALVGVLRIRRGIVHSRRADVFAGAVFLGLAASCKNEGLSLIAAVAVAMLAARAWRSLPMLWPALAIPFPWLVMQRLHRVHGYLEEKGSVDRLLLRLSEIPPIAGRMLERTGMPLLFWIGIGAAIVVVGRQLVRQERFLLVATVMQLLFYAAVYLVTPYEVRWHIDTSWDRILRQILPFIALLAMLPTAAVIASVLRRNNATDSRTDRPPCGAGAA